MPARNIEVSDLKKDIFIRYKQSSWRLNHPTHIGQYRPVRIQIELPGVGTASLQSCSICREQLGHLTLGYSHLTEVFKTTLKATLNN